MGNENSVTRWEKTKVWLLGIIAAVLIIMFIGGGRYQVVAVNRSVGTAYMIDKYTGKAWFLTLGDYIPVKRSRP